MKIATWNVNSIRKRMPRLQAWLQAENPDVLCLQETKVEDSAFPRADIEGLGYQIAFFGQRTYNGVAILARAAISQVTRGFGDASLDAEARFLAGTVEGVRVVSAYVPNGQAVGSEKFRYKLDWLARCRTWLAANVSPTQPLALCGDFNVAPEDRDVCDPELWQDQILCHPDERAAFAALVNTGLQDVLRRHHAEPGMFSWWDYRQLSFPKNQGLRIDHILATSALAGRSTDAFIDRNARKGPEPSDHAPVVAIFSWPPVSGKHPA